MSLFVCSGRTKGCEKHPCLIKNIHDHPEEGDKYTETGFSCHYTGKKVKCVPYKPKKGVKK